jgi:TonB family protein
MLKLAGLIALAAGVMLCQQNEEKVYRVGNGVAPPRVLSKMDPEYTKEAKDAQIEGTVLLSTTIGSDGVPRDVEVVRSLYPGLNEKAIAAVQQWKFQPGTKDGQAVAVKATIEVNFRLK